MGFLRGFLHLALIGTAVIWVFALPAREADNTIGLQFPPGGEALWFYRACRDTEKQDVAGWSVELDRLSGSQALSARLSNAYPGYQLQCELRLANTGQMPLAISQISIRNPNAQVLAVDVTPAAGETGRVLQPCRQRPAWGTAPGLVPANCQATINLSVRVNGAAGQNRNYAYGVQVLLSESVGEQP